MINEFITERLLLTGLAAEHAVFILKLVNTEGWLNFIGDRNVHTVEEAGAYIEKINKSGYAKYWTVYGKDSNEPIGIVTLIKRDYLDDHDIGFAFLPQYSGRGYAFEAVKPVLATLLNQPGYSTLAAVTVPANQRSIKLLKKLGFWFSREITRDNELLHIYEIGNMQTVQQLITTYNLLPHPEGGYYRETYRSSETIPGAALPSRFNAGRSFSTAIYFLLERGNFSAFHKIKSDECWHFYAGQTLLVHVLHADGQLETVKLGNNVAAGENFQYVVPAGCWFASEPAESTLFSFTGCTVAPGFDFADFELASAEKLITQYPQHEMIIRRLCRS